MTDEEYGQFSEKFGQDQEQKTNEKLSELNKEMSPHEIQKRIEFGKRLEKFNGREIGRPDADDSKNKKDLDDPEPPKRTVAEKLVDLTIGSGAEFYLDQLDEPHITFPDRPSAGFPIRSSTFRMWLAGKYWAEFEKGFSGETFSMVVGSLEGKAFHDRNSRELFNRVAKVGETIYYDLGDNSRVIKIISSGWEITDVCPVKFRRFNHQRVQVLPIVGGELPSIFKYLNLKSDADKLLFLTYLVAVLIPNVPRVVLVNIGDQGAAKSTALRIVRSLIDPSQSELLSPPSDIVELAQAANHHYCLYLDNLTYLRDDLSDALCRLATGIGFTKRKLYTDSEDIIFNQKTAIGLSGINLVAQKADLLDRCLIQSYERIPENLRVDEDEFWRNFEAEKPYILGALFDILSTVLRLIPDFKLSKKPRMADYAKYAAAAAVALGYTADEFLSAFSQNTGRQNQAAIESSPTAQVIIRFMSDKNDWTGSSSELHQKLRVLVEKSNLQIGGSDGFPKSSNWLWKRIMQVRPNILALGIAATKEDREEGSIITLIKSVQESENAVSTSSESDGAGDMEVRQADNPPLDNSKTEEDLEVLATEIFGSSPAEQISLLEGNQ